MRPVYLIAGALLVGAGVYAMATRKAGAGGVVQSVASDFGGGVVGVVADAVNGVVSGAALAVGDVVGLPRTDCQKCADAMNQFAAAPWWEKSYLSFKVSAVCPASDYFKWLGDANYRPSCS